MHSWSRLIFSHPLNDSLNAILTDKQSVEEQGSSDNYPDAQWDGKSRKSINDTVFNSTWRRELGDWQKRRSLISRGKEASLEQADSKLSNHSTVNSISALTMFIEAHYDFITIMEERRHGDINRYDGHGQGRGIECPFIRNNNWERHIFFKNEMMKFLFLSFL